MNWNNRKQEFIHQFSTEFGESEAQSMFRLIKDHFTTQEIINGVALETRWSQVLDRLTDLEPLQYILGYAWFYDLKIGVDKDVLIPRPETEELAHIIIQDCMDKPLNIIDIGTGSGCIALAMKSKLSQSKVCGIDISKEAITVASTNAMNLNLDILFKEADITQVDTSNSFKSFDIVISNPPYIDLLEQHEMEPYVTDNEPMIALFTPENDALYYYRSIVTFCKENLKTQGTLYLELNEYKATEIRQLCDLSGYFIDIELIIDLQGKPRFLRAKKQ